MNVPDRTIHPQMLVLTELALRYGLDEVSLGFEGLGSGFPAPIGWSLILTRREYQTIYQLTGEPPELDVWAPQCLRVDARVEETPTSYFGDPEAENAYLGFDQIAAWITQEDEFIPNPTPEEQEAFGKDIELFKAIKNGWEVTRSLRRDVSLRTAELTGKTVPVQSAYKFHASNGFYNVDGHEANHATGAPVSRELSLVRDDALSDQWMFGMENGKVCPPNDMLALIRSEAPWFVPVGYFEHKEGVSGEEGEWVY